MIKLFKIIIFSIIISFPVILPFFREGYFPTHDGEWAVVRLSDMFREIKDLQLPPRYSGNLNFGYGYPLFNFTYPFPYYLGFFIHLFKFNFVDSVKILFAASVPLSAFFMFLVSQKLWRNNLSGVVSSILYVYTPYRFVDLYVRGSIGESISFVLFPLIIFLILKQIETGKPLFFISTAFSYSILILTHNIMSVLFSPVIFILIFSFAVFKKNIQLKHLILSLMLGLLLAAFFWVPALFEKQNILLSKIPIADRSLYYVSFHQLVIPKFGYNVPIEKDGFSYQIGLSQLVVLSLSILLFTYLWLKKKNFKENDNLNFFGMIILISLALIFLLFSPSTFFWENTPLFKEINYPWTILAPLGFLLSFMSGFLTYNRITSCIALFASLMAIYICLPYARPREYVNRGDLFYFTNDATTTSSQELMPLWVKKIPIERSKNKVEIIEGNGKVEKIIHNSKEISFMVIAEDKLKIRINTIYYPGWDAFVNNNKSSINYSNKEGVMDVKVEKGIHVVKLIFSETPLRLFADLLSIIAFVGSISYIFYNKLRLALEK